METQVFGSEASVQTHDELPRRSLRQSMRRGLSGKCPSCGEGELFSHWITVNEACDACGEELFHHRADDLPAYLNIFIVGHVVVAAMMVVMQLNLFGMWTIAFGTAIAALIAGLACMRPIKGTVVGSQWALRMHGFGGNED